MDPLFLNLLLRFGFLSISLLPSVWAQEGGHPKAHLGSSVSQPSSSLQVVLKSGCARSSSVNDCMTKEMLGAAG
ncbi:unnamed protein product [Camellia sinensis]